MRLLITRPKDEAESFAKLVRERGHTPVIGPVMEVIPHAGPELKFDGVQAVLATSANGVRALAARTPNRELTVYAVGPQTAEAAQSAGFKSVHNAAGDAMALVEFVTSHADPAKGKLLHAAGEETAGRLRQALQAKGFTVDSVVLYAARPVETLPEAVQNDLANNLLDGVLLFSPRSAAIFAELVTKAKLTESCARLTAFCISAATAAALAPLTFERMAVAGQPNQDAMLVLLPTPVPAP